MSYFRAMDWLERVWHPVTSLMCIGLSFLIAEQVSTYDGLDGWIAAGVALLLVKVSVPDKRGES